MKKTSLHLTVKTRLKTVLFTVIILLLGVSSNAQLLAHYTLRSSGTNPAVGKPYPGTVASCVNAGDMIQGNLLSGSGNSTGFRLKYGGPDDYWPATPTDGYHLDFPFSPTGGNDFNISSITFRDTLPENSPNLMVYATFRVDNAGPWQKLANPVNLTGNTFADFNLATNETFYNGHTYVIRFYVYGNGAGIGKNAAKRIEWLKFNGTCSSTPAQPVTVTTLTATATGKYTATATGSYTYNGTQYYLVKQSGFIWSTSSAALTTMDTSATTKTTNGSAGTINSTLTGLSAGTTYYVKAYIVTQFGIQYGLPLSFKTSDPTAPTVTTNPITNVLSNKATGGGAIPDSGGLPITAKGLVWNLTGSPTLNSNTGKIILTGGNAPFDFSDLIKGLNPSTNYCYRAFATNSMGTSYGPDVCFTTASPAPVLTAIPGTIDFGDNFFGSSSITVSYFLTGNFLTPTGTISISIPPTAGFEISLSSNCCFGTTPLSIPYTGGKLVKTPIYVRFTTGKYGNFSGVITHSGGGVAPADADVVNVKGAVVQSPDDVTNRGTEFWLGFGYEEKMNQKAGTSTEAKMTVYVAAGSQPATVIVDIPGIPSFTPVTLNLGPNGTGSVGNFPTGDPGNTINSGNFPDARLFFTGVTNRAVRVRSTNGSPVSVWLYIAADNNSAAGSMVFPVNTWNSSYTVQAYGGKSNVGNPPNSFFFVIPEQDNTEIEFWPSNDILDNVPGAIFQDGNTAAMVKYPKQTNLALPGYKVTLNRGQVFNAMGFVSGSGSNSAIGLDLSGTVVRTTCDKKITVFGGNGRCLVSTPVSCPNPTSGSDNMIQQMIPSVAWGTKYFSVPTKHMETNLFRVYVSDPTKPITVTPAPSPAPVLVNNLYYQFQSNKPQKIESETPISVTQLITSCAGLNATTTGNSGKGDPEMIILSAAQQSITSATVYCPTFANGVAGAAYLNVVIKTSGVSTFKLDNVVKVDTGVSSYTGTFMGTAPLVNTADAFKPFASDPSYSWAKIRLSYPGAHTMSAAEPFNAIAYGVNGDGESWGFNAGTAIRNLSSYKISVNPKGTDSSSTVVRTCVNTPITLKIAFPYNPNLVDSIQWSANNPNVSPNNVLKGTISGGKAVFDGTIDIEGRTFYIYTSPVKYTFSSLQLYRFTATAFGTFASDCPGEDRQTILVNVGQDNLNLQAIAKCNNPKVQFIADTIPMVGTNILSWKWDFGDTTTATDSIALKYHTYQAGATTAYKVKLTSLNSVGCYSTDSIDVDFGGGLKADFTISDDAICAGDNTTFTDASFGSGTSGSPNDWKWTFDDSKTFDGQAPPAQSYATPGIKTISLTVTTPIGCVNTKKDTVTVEATPVAKFTATPACLGSDMTFTDASTIAIGTIDTRIWTFGEGANAPVTSTNPTITHKYLAPGRYEVTLSVKSAGGCPSTVLYKDSVTVVPLPIDSFDIDVNCTTKEVTFTDKSITNGGTISTYNWTIDGVPVTKGATFKQSFNDVLNHTVTLKITTSNGCSNTVGFSRSFTISASPTADFELPAKVCLPNDAAIFTNKTTITDGTEAQISYVWDFGDGPGQSQAAPAPSTISHTYLTAKSYTVKLTATSGAGCTSTATKTLNNVYAQPKATFTAPAEVCVNAKAALSGTGISGAEWYWNFGAGFGAISKKDTVASWNVSGDTTIKHYYVTTLGCISDTASKTITVNALPVNIFEKDIDCSIKKVTFTDKSTTAPVGSTITKRHWVFGDGARDDGNNATVSHTYTGSGPYTATLWVESSKGCQDSSNRATTTFTISATPASSFTLPTGNICLPAGVATFTNTSTISDGTQAQFINSWDFGDATKKDTTTGLAPVNHIFPGVGPYTVKLITTSVNGCTNTATPQVINTIFAQPKAALTAPAEVCLNSQAIFTSAGDNAPGSTPAQWYWDLGTGSFGTLSKKDTVASWAVDGPQVIRHYFVSAAGCISDTTAPRTITVNALPQASFSQVAVSCAGKVVNFADASSGTSTSTVVEWRWFFGDGQTAVLTTAGATHTYELGGSYIAKLVVKDNKGCYSDTFPLPVTVYPNPVPLFTVSDICIPSVNPVFTDASTITSGSVTDWKWTLGDNTDTLHLSSFTHEYKVGGIYKVTLTAISDQGCPTTGAAVDVTVTSAPIAQDSVLNINNLCSSSKVELINQSVPNGFGIVSKIEIFWDNAGDLSMKTVDNAPVPFAIYRNKYPDLSADKDYDVLIRAYSNNGCFKDSIRTIKVLASPKLGFAALANICEEHDTLTLVIPTDSNSLPIRNAFFSGDGIVPDTNRFVPLLAGPGSHTITYTDTATNGCASVATQPIFVYATPTIRMDALRTVLLGDNITLNPTVTGNIQTYTWTPGTYLDNASIIKPVTTPSEDITYKLHVVTKDGCSSDSSVKVLVLQDFKVPNTFTPNNDGRNDFWIIEQLPRYPVQRVQVFNRYGQIVYETKKYDPVGWDGNFKGKPLPIGTYYYIIELNGMVQPKVGYVTILK